MFNKLIFFLFVTLGLTVIVLCIYKSTKIEEHYKTNSLSYSDVILPCDKIEMKKSYKIDNVIKVIKKYNIDTNDLKTIKNKLKGKGIKGKICERALNLILDTYLIYYKPIVPLIINDLKNKNFNRKKVNDKSLPEEDDKSLPEEDDKSLPEDEEESSPKEESYLKREDDEEEEEEEEAVEPEYYHEEEYGEENKKSKINCNNLDSMVTVLEADGFITNINKNTILKHYGKFCTK